jgi:frataxin-like iron-binding protein CyaY
MLRRQPPQSYCWVDPSSSGNHIKIKEKRIYKKDLKEKK